MNLFIILGVFPRRLYLQKVLTFEGELAVHNHENALARFYLQQEKSSPPSFHPQENLVVERITFKSVGLWKQLAGNHTTELAHLTLYKRKNKHQEPPACIEYTCGIERNHFAWEPAKWFVTSMWRFIRPSLTRRLSILSKKYEAFFYEWNGLLWDFGRTRVMNNMWWKMNAIQSCLVCRIWWFLLENEADL